MHWTCNNIAKFVFYSKETYLNDKLKLNRFQGKLLSLSLNIIILIYPGATKLCFWILFRYGAWEIYLKNILDRNFLINQFMKHTLSKVAVFGAQKMKYRSSMHFVVKITNWKSTCWRSPERSFYNNNYCCFFLLCKSRLRLTTRNRDNCMICIALKTSKRQN